MIELDIVNPATGAQVRIAAEPIVPASTRS